MQNKLLSGKTGRMKSKRMSALVTAAVALGSFGVADSSRAESTDVGVETSFLGGDAGWERLQNIAARQQELGATGAGTAQMAAKPDAALREMLRRDSSLRVASSGRLVYLDPMRPELTRKGDGSEVRAIPDGVDVFALSSNPQASVTIYLDFNGHTAVKTEWNVHAKRDKLRSWPLDIDGNANAFSDTEQRLMYWVWANVAEDFSPWQVNVTTKEPAIEDLIKTSASDARYGVRAVVFSRSEVPGAGTEWLGVAFMDSIYDAADTPVFALGPIGPEQYTITANIVSHEVGHALGLNHDGVTEDGETHEYYVGHDYWSPIMGAGFNEEDTSRWSNGDYAGATNTENDLAIIGRAFPMIKDDYPNSARFAAPLPAKEFTGYLGIEDEDWFLVRVTGREPSYVSYIASVDDPEKGGLSSNLDLVLEFRSLDGNGGSQLLSWRVRSCGSELVCSAWEKRVLVTPGEYLLRVFPVDRFPNYGAPISAYGATGRYTVRVKGAVARGSAPVFSGVVVSPAAPVAGEPVTITARSSDPDGDAVSTVWQVPGTSDVQGASLTRSFNSGKATMNVVLTDSSGLTTIAPVSVQVLANQAPTMNLTVVGGTTATAPAVFALQARGSDPDGRPVTIVWQFSDGTTAGGPNVTKALAQAGSIKVAVTATDSGGLTARAFVTLTAVPNQAPKVSISVNGALSRRAPATFEFKATATDHEGDALTYLWVFSDGTTATGTRAAKKLTKAGELTARVTVSDTAGNATSTSVRVIATK